MPINRKEATKLAWACEANMRALQLARVAAAGGSVQRSGRAAWGMAPGPLSLGGHHVLPFPRLNQRMADAVIARVVDEFRATNRPIFATLGHATVPLHLRPTLKRFGFEYALSGIGMALRLDQVTPPAGSPHTIIQTRSLEQCRKTELHPYFGTRANNNPPETWDNSIAVAEKMVQRSPKRAWQLMVKIDGQPAGSAFLFRAAGVLGVYDVGVIPEQRHRGIATALLHEAVRLGQSLGETALILQCNAGLERLYGPVGFERVTTLDHWHYAGEVLNRPVPTAAERNTTDVSVAFEWLIHALAVDDAGAVLHQLDQNPALATTASDRGTTLLHQAAWEGNLAVAERLIQLAAPLEYRERQFGSTPLFWAIFGAQFNSAQRQQTDVLARLLAAGADPNVSNQWGETAWAAAQGNAPIRQLLQQHGVEESA